MTTNPTPVRGEVWRIRFDPAEGDEIKKVRTAVVISEMVSRKIPGPTPFRLSPFRKLASSTGWVN